MSPSNEDKPLVLIGNDNFRGCYATIEDAIRVYNGLCREGYINRENRKVRYDDIVRHLKNINSQIEERYRHLPQVVKDKALIIPTQKKSKEFILMLESAKNNNPNWRKYFHSEVARAFNTLADQNYKIVLKIGEQRKTDINFVKVEWVDRINEELSATKIHSDFLLNQFVKNGSKPRSVFTSNPMAILELFKFAIKARSIEEINILAQNLFDDSEYYSVGKRKGISESELKLRQQRMLSSIDNLQDLSAEGIRVRVRYSDRIFLSDDPSLVITDLKYGSGKFKVCAAANFMESLYFHKYRCCFYAEPTRYISEVITRQMNIFDDENS